jgi:hypothetical protein
VKKTTPHLHPRTVIFYYAAVLVACALGTVLAYVGPLSSEAWQCWSGSGAWKRDVLRALVASFLCYFGLVQMGVIAGVSPKAKDVRRLFPDERWEWGIFLGLVALLLVVLFKTGTTFLRDLPPHCKPDVGDEFQQIWKPYIPYLVYATGLWFGIIWPVFLCLLRCIGRDIEWYRDATDGLDKSLPQEKTSVRELTAEAFDKLIVAFQDCVGGLKGMSERYLSILLIVVLALLYEQLTPSHETVTRQAVEWGKIALWLLLGPSLLIFLIFVASGYQEFARKVESGLHIFSDALTRSHKHESGLLARVFETRAKLMWDQSSTSFVVSVIKSASIAMPLIIAIGGYAVETLSGGEWIDMFLPKVIREGVVSVYSR